MILNTPTPTPHSSAPHVPPVEIGSALSHRLRALRPTKPPHVLSWANSQFRQQRRMQAIHELCHTWQAFLGEWDLAFERLMFRNAPGGSGSGSGSGGAAPAKDGRSLQSQMRQDGANGGPSSGSGSARVVNLAMPAHKASPSVATGVFAAVGVGVGGEAVAKGSGAAGRAASAASAAGAAPVLP